VSATPEGTEFTVINKSDFVVTLASGGESITKGSNLTQTTLKLYKGEKVTVACARGQGHWIATSVVGNYPQPLGADNSKVFFENDTNVTADYTITSGKNAISAGPITVNTGITVTVPAGSVWTIV
jgi:hypothetical protein